jgi:AcrR family transcriptional regulator
VTRERNRGRDRAAGKASNRSNAAPAAYETRHIELLKAAATLFAERGFHRSSIRDLAKSTGRSLAGLYYYFSGKEELLFQIQHHCYGALLREVRKILADARTPHEKLITFISHHIAFFRHNMDEMKVLAHEDLTLTGEYLERIMALKREYSRILVDIVAAAEPAADDRPDRPAPEVAAFVLFGMMNWLYTWPKRLRRLPAEEIAATIAQIFLCGYPGCSVAELADLRERLVCNRQGFWKRKAI